MQDIEIIGAKKHNLKSISLKIPKRHLVCITGVSGSGKSTLAYDTIFQEGQRKYLESLSIYARQFIKSLEKPDVQAIRGISPTISIDQKHSSFYYNSTVGTISEVSHYLRLLYARVGEAQCPGCGKKIRSYSTQRVTDYIFQQFSQQLVYIFAPVVKNRKGIYKALFEKYLKRGFLKALIDGEVHYLDNVPSLSRNLPHNIAILIDAVKITKGNRKQVEESTALASFESHGEIIVIHHNREYFFSNKLYCPDCNISIKEPQPATFSFNSPVAVCPACSGRGVDSYDDDICRQCGGSGFNEWALSFYFKGKNIFELGEIEIVDLLEFFKSVKLTEDETTILAPILPQIVQRLESFIKLNLGYITLNRKINTLSGGELQRARLVSQIGFSLSGIIYILDEPSIGMHMSEQQNLIGILKELKKKDNTVIVVEHDELTIKSSDYIVDLGPGAGEKGGNLTYCGWYRDFKQAAGSLTADYMFKRKTVTIEKAYTYREQTFVEIAGLSINNIINADVRIPLRSLIVVTGVSGSGKSSLIIDALYPIVKGKIAGGDHDFGRKQKRLTYKTIKGTEGVGRIMMVTQTAIGKNARSCPATYINIMPLIRELFAGLTESKIRGYGPGRFSYNVSGGRCEACSGLGYKKLEMSFLPELEVPCPVCEGRRYNSETLRVRYNGLSIADVLELTATEAYNLFRNIPLLAKKIKILIEVGLGYLKLGQSSVTLSGGESQRIKLTKELSRISAKPTIYLMDEPTIGLHFDDIQKLIYVFQGLIARGSTVVVIEHNMEIIKAADYIIDLGPGGGKDGGKILYQGKPTALTAVKESLTGKFLSKVHSIG
ncbi:MAG: ABC-ATPase UvrA [Candidatus Aminicenantes bacterium]|nr:ABC-ATPase UvrA [Candidatus Aminicenantes bacterium]NIM85128.1 ABC-ATPase UvrA [Candidatus Aminicenantes bacterium]NIN24638.1 ABC-ATPase UvrA [Candidatus Aminicenantes bacterium]NIN48399.1 ABC-ATPase UvrA [Candidatus Aminicenantes bacterium]NIN91302.1 ABC-ATPase UvrA [Candidatus Aminicenantes bacterium]